MFVKIKRSSLKPYQAEIVNTIIVHLHKTKHNYYYTQGTKLGGKAN